MSKVKYIIEVDKEDIDIFLTAMNENYIIHQYNGEEALCGRVLLSAFKTATPITESDDAMSRQAVLDIAKSSKSNWIDNSVLFKRVNELPSVTPKRERGEWISVKDRLPEESGLYLILCREENTLHDTVEFNPYLDMYYPNSNPTSWERWSNDCYNKSKVVAWMPIPNYGEEE